MKGSGGGHRGMRRTLDRARRHKPSSQRWLERQLNDPYVARAKAEGLRSRSAYKLSEIDDKHGLLKPGRRVIDLGAAPGGWAQVAVKRVGSTPENPLVGGVDLLEMEPLAGAAFIVGDFEAPETGERLLAMLKGPPDVVLSDMAAATTGHRQTDHLRTQRLAEAAAEFAIHSLAPGGDFLVKTFRGGADRELLATLRRSFDAVAHIKPRSSRAESVELYLMAKNRQ